MSKPIVTTRTSTVPNLPDHAFRMVKVIETRKDANNHDVHHLTVFLEHLIDGTPTRTKVATLALTPDGSDTPSLTWQGYMEREH